MNYYNEIKEYLINNEIYKKVKDYSKNKSDLQTYYNVGKLIVEAQGGEERAKYGDRLIKEYSKKLIEEVGKKYNERTLRRIRQFYIVSSNIKWSPMATKLTWSHYCEMLVLKDINAIKYYCDICINNNLGKRELRKKIKNKEYERLSLDTKNKLIVEEEPKVNDLIKNEYKIKIGNRYNYIGLLLFNYKYNCFVVIELKITELKKEHIGQIQTYMNYIDKNVKSINQDKTIGIIICKKGNEFIMEYSSDDRIFETNFILN